MAPAPTSPSPSVASGGSRVRLALLTGICGAIIIGLLIVGRSLGIIDRYPYNVLGEVIIVLVTECVDVYHMLTSAVVPRQNLSTSTRATVFGRRMGVAPVRLVKVGIWLWKRHLGHGVDGFLQ